MKRLESKSPKQESRHHLNLIPRSKSQDLWQTLEKIKQQKQKIKLKLEKLVLKLDTFTNARTTVTFFFLFFLLGQSLNYYLIGILILYIFLMIYRFIRFWIKHSLMYMLDFIYFGNICMILFLLFYRNDLNLFLNVFSCSSGVIALTVITEPASPSTPSIKLTALEIPTIHRTVIGYENIPNCIGAPPIGLNIVSI